MLIWMSGKSQIVTSPSWRTIFWSSNEPVWTYSLVCASRRRSHWNPAAVSPVRARPRAMSIPHTARIVPLASGSRISTRPFHLGSSRSSQS